MDVANLPAWAALAVAAAAGATSFLSPCVAPLLPGYLAFIGPEGSRLPRSVGFVAGFTALFALLGASAAALSRTLLDHRAELELVSGLLVAVFGLTMAFGRSIVPQGIAARAQARTSTLSAPLGALAAVPVGAAFAIAWSPCIGPALAAILALAAGDARPGFGALLLVAYGIGLGIPFLLGAVALDRVGVASRALRRHGVAIRVVGGTLLLLLGVAIATGRFGDVTARLAPLTPDWLV